MDGNDGMASICSFHSRQFTIQVGQPLPLARSHFKLSQPVSAMGFVDGLSIVGVRGFGPVFPISGDLDPVLCQVSELRLIEPLFVACRRKEDAINASFRGKFDCQRSGRAQEPLASPSVDRKMGPVGAREILDRSALSARLGTAGGERHIAWCGFCRPDFQLVDIESFVILGRVAPSFRDESDVLDLCLWENLFGSPRMGAVPCPHFFKLADTFLSARENRPPGARHGLS